jgi:hypothetical protein
MASTYNFMGLVNDVCVRLNEEPLDSTNFDNVDGFYSAAKMYVNAAIRDINQLEYNWPFNHNTTQLDLVAGDNRYSYPAEAKVIDFDTIRLVPDETLGVKATRLKQIQYNEYVKNYIDEEYKTAAQGSVPSMVCMSQARELVFVPSPDEDYEVEFEYFIYPVDMVNATDVPTIPERFRHVIVDGAMYHAYMFRDNPQAAQIAQKKFEDGIKAMTSLLINEFINVVDTRTRAGLGY